MRRAQRVITANGCACGTAIMAGLKFFFGYGAAFLRLQMDADGDNILDACEEGYSDTLGPTTPTTDDE